MLLPRLNVRDGEDGPIILKDDLFNAPTICGQRIDDDDLVVTTGELQDYIRTIGAQLFEPDVPGLVPGAGAGKNARVKGDRTRKCPGSHQAEKRCQ